MGAHERMFRHEHAHKLDDEDRRRWMPADEILARLDLRPGLRVADVGAGTGYFALPIARAVAGGPGGGGAVLAVDVQPEMLDRLRAKLEPALPVTLVHGEATRTTLDDASVDLAFFANVWHELDDVPAALAEVSRIVRPGGRLAILEWRPQGSEGEPGPPREHRVAADDVVRALASGGWRAGPPALVGSYHYLVLATRDAAQ